LVVSLNWGIYIWAVANHRVLEASMGYFLTPLLNVLAGVVVFREKLSRSKLVAIFFAAAGVAWYFLSTDILPWVAGVAWYFLSTDILPWVVLAVGFSFALYGLLRKQMETNAVPGLFVEILLLLPFTLALILWLHQQGEAAFLNHARQTDWLLILAGPVTVLPLAFFTAADDDGGHPVLRHPIAAILLRDCSAQRSLRFQQAYRFRRHLDRAGYFQLQPV
jgi:chloramphenicol-sensitive protein RarD